MVLVSPHHRGDDMLVKRRVQKLVDERQCVAFLSELAECGKMSAMLELRQSVTNKESLRPTMVHHQTIVL